MADYAVPTTPVASSPATTFELPNFVGELFSLVPAQTPLLNMIGGLTGGKAVASKEHVWQVEDNEAAGINNVALEGDDPVDKSIIRQEITNVVEIHQESVNISYTKQAAVGQLGPRIDGAGAPLPFPEPAPILGTQPVQTEISHQLELKINKVARDVERSMLNGAFQSPSDNLTERQMNGVLTPLSTHVLAYDGTSIRTTLNALLAGMYEDEMKVAPLINPVLFMNGTTKTWLSMEYSNNLGLADRSRIVGGVNVETIVTDFGTFGVVLDRYMPVDQIALIDVSVLVPVFLPIPGKGHFFTEPLAKTGAYDRVQLYGEIGLEYGPEQYHGLITDIVAPA